MTPRHLMMAVLTIWLAGCSHLSPQTVPRDRFDYNTAIDERNRRN